MAILKEIQSHATQLEAMQLLVETYEEIAAIHMRNIRSGVLTNRTFIDGLEIIYQELEASYQAQVHKLVKKRKNQHGLVTKKNGKDICVLLSTNAGLNGEIIRQTFDVFYEYIQANPQVDVMIVGTIGQQFMKQTDPKRSFISYETKEDRFTPESIAQLISSLLEYENIYLFYGKFHTFTSQTPFMLDVYGQRGSASEQNNPIYYLFEPSLEKILQFFESQIFSSIIEQSFRESNLARYAGRMMSLDRATQNIDDALRKVELERRISIHKLLNQKQQQVMNTMFLWKMK